MRNVLQFDARCLLSAKLNTVSYQIVSINSRRLAENGEIRMFAMFLKFMEAVLWLRRMPMATVEGRHGPVMV